MTDLRFALRQLLKSPGFTIVAVFTLALGIGANTAIFTIVNAVFLEKLPYPTPTESPSSGRRTWSGPGVPTSSPRRTLSAGRNGLTAFESLAAYAETRANLTEAGNPEELIAQNVTAEYFSVIGVGPFLGRAFTPRKRGPPNRRRSF